MICTSIKQSQHLLELGLSPDSADMEYCYIDEFNSGLQVKSDTNAEVDQRLDKIFGVTHIPAWSLSALLELMPKVIVHDMNKHVLCLKYAEGAIPLMYYVVENGRNKGKLIRFDNGRCAPDAGDALDAAYEMVCWLLEQGLIKKGDNNE